MTTSPLRITALLIVLGCWSARSAEIAESAITTIGTPDPRTEYVLNRRIDVAYEQTPIYKVNTSTDVRTDLVYRVGLRLSIQAPEFNPPHITLKRKQATVSAILQEIARQANLQVIVRGTHIALVKKTPNDILQSLANRLKSVDPVERCQAVYELGRLNALDALALVIEAFADPDPLVRSQVLNSAESSSSVKFLPFVQASHAVADAFSKARAVAAGAKQHDYRIYRLLQTLPEPDSLLAGFKFTRENSYMVVQALGLSKTDQAIRLLQVGLQPENFHVRLPGLIEIGSPEALAVLQTLLLQVEYKAVRGTILVSIAEIGTDEALAVVKSKLAESDVWTQQWVATVLGEAPSANADALLLELAQSRESRFRACAALCRRGHDVGRVLLPAMAGIDDYDNEYKQDRDTVYRIIFQTRDLEIIRKLARSDDAQFRAAANIALACESGDAALIPAALESYAKLEPGAQVMAVPRLACLRDPRVEQHFLNELKAGKLNSYNFSERAIDEVATLLQIDNMYVRKAAVWALGGSSSPRAALLLKALQTLHSNDDGSLINTLGQQLGRADVNAALVALAQQNTSAGNKAAYMLARSDDPSVIIELATSGNPVVRARSASILDTADPRQRTLLLKLLTDDNLKVRASAGGRLDEFLKSRDPRIVGLLPKLANDDSLQIRRRAVKLMTLLSEAEAVSLLIAISAKPDQAGQEAIHALQYYDDPRVIARLIELATPEHPFRTDVAIVLQNNLHRFIMEPARRAEIEKRLQQLKVAIPPLPPSPGSIPEGTPGEF